MFLGEGRATNTQAGARAGAGSATTHRATGERAAARCCRLPPGRAALRAAALGPARSRLCRIARPGVVVVVNQQRCGDARRNIHAPAPVELARTTEPQNAGPPPTARPELALPGLPAPGRDERSRDADDASFGAVCDAYRCAPTASATGQHHVDVADARAGCSGPEARPGRCVGDAPAASTGSPGEP